MAKGLRASTRKRNNAALRAKVFGPAVDARTERLSTKLLELAAKPRPDQERIMEVDEDNSKEQDNRLGTTESKDTEDIEIDAQDAKMNPVHSTASQKHRPSRIEKKIAKRKAKKAVVFAPNARQRKRMELKGTKS